MIDTDKRPGSGDPPCHKVGASDGPVRTPVADSPYHHQPLPGSASGTRGVSECQAPSLSEPYCP
jgi:hypothetical protein